MHTVTSGPAGGLDHPSGSKKKVTIVNDHPMTERHSKFGKQTPGSFLATENLDPIADIPQNFPCMNLIEVLRDFDSQGRGLKFFKGFEQEDID